MSEPPTILGRRAAQLAAMPERVRHDPELRAWWDSDLSHRFELLAAVRTRSLRHVYAAIHRKAAARESSDGN